MNKTEFKNISFEENCSYEASLRDSVRKDYHSKLGREQRKHLNPGFRSLIEDFIDGKDVKRLDLFDNWTRAATEHWEIDLQTYFNDEYLKEVGLYEVAVEARKEYERNFDPEEEVRFQAERDRLNYLKAYEDNDHLPIRDRLKPSFHQEIIDYLYNGGTAPRRMDCWDAPIAWLIERGLAEEVLDMGKITDKKKKQEEFIEKYNEYIFFNEEFDEIIMYRAKMMGVCHEALWNRYEEFVDAISDGRNNTISAPLWSEFCRFELKI